MPVSVSVGRKKTAEVRKILFSREGHRQIVSALGSDNFELVQRVIGCIADFAVRYEGYRHSSRYRSLETIQRKFQATIADIKELDERSARLIADCLLESDYHRCLSDRFKPKAVDEMVAALERYEGVFTSAMSKAKPSQKGGPPKNEAARILDSELIELFKSYELSLSTAEGRPREGIMRYAHHLIGVNLSHFTARKYLKVIR